MKELKDKMLRIEDKVDLVTQVNNNQNVILGKMEVLFQENTKILKEHERRSIAAENRQDILEKHVTDFDKKFDNHLSFIRGACWICGIAASCTGLYAIIEKFI